MPVSSGSKLLHAHGDVPIHHLLAVLCLGEVFGDPVTVHVAEVGDLLANAPHIDVNVSLVVRAVQFLLDLSHGGVQQIQSADTVEDGVIQFLPVGLHVVKVELVVGFGLTVHAVEEAVEIEIQRLVVLVHVGNEGLEILAEIHVSEGEDDIIRLHGGVLAVGVLLAGGVGVVYHRADAAAFKAHRVLLDLLGTEGAKLVDEHNGAVHTEPHESCRIRRLQFTGEGEAGGVFVFLLVFVPQVVVDLVPILAVVGKEHGDGFWSCNAPIRLLQNAQLQGVDGGELAQIVEEFISVAAGDEEPFSAVTVHILAVAQLAVGEDGGVGIGSLLCICLQCMGGLVAGAGNLLDQPQQQILTGGVVTLGGVPIHILLHVGEVQRRVKLAFRFLGKSAHNTDLLHPAGLSLGEGNLDIAELHVFRQQQGVGVMIVASGGVSSSQKGVTLTVRRAENIHVIGEGNRKTLAQGVNHDGVHVFLGGFQIQLHTAAGDAHPYGFSVESAGMVVIGEQGIVLGGTLVKGTALKGVALVQRQVGAVGGLCRLSRGEGGPFASVDVLGGVDSLRAVALFLGLVHVGVDLQLIHEDDTAAAGHTETDIAVFRQLVKGHGGGADRHISRGGKVGSAQALPGLAVVGAGDSQNVGDLYAVLEHIQASCGGTGETLAVLTQIDHHSGIPGEAYHTHVGVMYADVVGLLPVGELAAEEIGIMSGGL